MNELRTWIKGIDPTIYDIERKLRETNVVEFPTYNFKYNIGEIVYLYIGEDNELVQSHKPAHDDMRIRYKTKVVEIKDQMEDDRRYYLKPEKFKESDLYQKTIRVVLIDDKPLKDLTKPALVSNGIKMPLLGPRPLKEEPIRYLVTAFAKN
jgi:hypothetical protein